MFVSDEDDKSPWPVNDYVNVFRDIKPLADRQAYNASALVVGDVEVCSSSQVERGERYIDLTRQSRGVVGDICSQTSQDIAGELSLNASRMRNTCFLASETNLATLQVSSDGDEISCADGRWTYRDASERRFGEDRAALVFAPDQLPPVGAQLVARYMDGVADLNDFCREAS